MVAISDCGLLKIRRSIEQGGSLKVRELKLPSTDSSGSVLRASSASASGGEARGQNAESNLTEGLLETEST